MKYFDLSKPKKHKYTNMQYTDFDWLDVCLPLAPLVQEEVYIPTFEELKEFNEETETEN